jgi:hypothetical protein
LGNIGLLVRFTTGAIQEFERSLPKRDTYIVARDKVVEGFQNILQSLVDPPRFDADQIRAGVDRALIVAEPSQRLLYSLSLVMICTEVEIFIQHLIDVILTSEPRQLKGRWSEKQVSAGELVDLGDYRAVMKHVREKVSKDVVDSSARDMFMKYLGKQFGLFRDEEFVFRRLNEGKTPENWGIAEIEALWNTRHLIVHEGQLPVDRGQFDVASGRCLLLEAFLSFRAREKYGMAVDSPQNLDQIAKLFGFSHGAS